MESLVYFVIIAFFLVAALVVAAFGALGFGVIGLVVALVVALAKRSGTKALLRLCGISASLAIVGTLLLLLMGGGTLLLAHYVHQIIWLQQHHQEARCLELSVAEDYKLIITEFQDGSYEATLTRRDDSQNYVYGITRYAIVDQYMLGETPYYWFWFDLEGPGPGHYFDRWVEFEQAIEELGLTETPVLLPLAVHCESEMCTPCSSSSEEP